MQPTGTQITLAGFTETAFNTVPGAPDGERLYVQSFNVTGTAGRITDPTLSGYRGEVRSVEDAEDVSGDVVVTIAPESIGFWLKHLFGAPVTTGVGPYTHTFTAAMPGETGALPAGMLIEKDLSSAIAAPGRFLRYSGLRVNNGSFNFAARGSLASLTLSLLGAGVDATAVAALDATLTDPGHSGFSTRQISIELDGGAITLNALSGTLAWGNDLDPDLFVLNGTGQRASLPEGFARPTGNVEAILDSADLLNKVLGDVDGALVYTLSRGDGLGTAGNESLVISVPDMVFRRTTPATPGPRGLRLPLQFTSHRTSGELGVTAVLKNARATI